MLRHVQISLRHGTLGPPGKCTLSPLRWYTFSRAESVTGTRSNIGDKNTLRFGYGSGLCSLMRNVYERGVVIEVWPDQRRAGHFLRVDPENVVLNLSIVPHATRSAVRKKNIMVIAAAWNPQEYCRCLP